jgi:transcriptional regulator with XRE-family HTH domain
VDYGSVSVTIGAMSSDATALKKLGKNVKTQRSAVGLTQERLAELCEFDSTYISLIERGKRNAPFLSLYKIAKNLKCKVSDLMDGL